MQYGSTPIITPTRLRVIILKIFKTRLLNYEKLWDKKVKQAREFGRKARRGDGFVAVSDQELMSETVIGAV